MPSDELIELLQRTVAREMQVVIQYMWQHVRATGMKSPAVADELKKVAIEEMKHAETAAERLDYFGVEATTTPTPITVGTTLREMIELDKAAEEEAIALYKLAIKKATGRFDTPLLAVSSADSLRSTPITCPSEVTRLAIMNVSTPVPQQTSKICSPPLGQAKFTHFLLKRPSPPKGR